MGDARFELEEASGFLANSSTPEASSKIDGRLPRVCHRQASWANNLFMNAAGLIYFFSDGAVAGAAGAVAAPEGAAGAPVVGGAAALLAGSAEAGGAVFCV